MAHVECLTPTNAESRLVDDPALFVSLKRLRAILNSVMYPGQESIIRNSV